MFDVGRSMFDVQSVNCSGQAKFHTKVSALTVLKPPDRMLNGKLAEQGEN
jgi:hypothetical protein